MAEIKNEDGVYIFRHTVGGRNYSFNVDYVPEDKRGWFCEVVGRQMDEIDSQARLAAELGVKRNIRNALGI